MCFSETASFGAAAILTTIGVFTLKKVEKPNQILFASIPLIFAAQQFTEGFVWMSLLHPKYAGLEYISTFLFLFFAQVLWPLFVPLSMFIMEKTKSRKTILMSFAILGIVVALYRFYWLLDVNVEAKIIEQHITYKFDTRSDFTKFYSVVYFLTTVTSTFISSGKKMKTLGIAILISVIISRIFFYHYFISVWCFMAAIISVFVYIIIKEMNRKENLKTEVTV
ncbi:MAG: hypothetical protein IPI31_03845 [Bacteroidetes bacterium]|nr:hypothetical protein [Bacteroidota bacterium]